MDATETRTKRRRGPTVGDNIVFIKTGGPKPKPVTDVTTSAPDASTSTPATPAAVAAAAAAVTIDKSSALPKPSKEALLGVSAWRPDRGGLYEESEAYSGSADPIVSVPFDVVDTYQAFRLSSYLAPVIGAMVTNVYQGDPSFPANAGIDVKDDKRLREQVRDYLTYRRSKGDFEAEPVVSNRDVTNEIKRIRRRIVNESTFLRSWFKNCCIDMSYLRLRILTGMDMEISGAAYWEVLRDARGRPAKVAWCPSWTMRPQPTEGHFVDYSVMQQETPIHWERVRTQRKFRGFIQIDQQGNVVSRYKEYGDPRIRSQRTGRYYTTMEDLLASDKERGSKPATEILQFQIPSPDSWAYGKSDWISSYPNAVGGRDLEEMNMGVITDQVIPQLMLMISGGRGVSKEDQQRLQQQILQNAKDGNRGIYLLHARPGNQATGRSSDVTMHLERLKSEQHQDALGLNYLKHSKDRIRACWRLPKVSLGDEEGTNRSTASMLLRLAENQVYQPRREVFDDVIQSTIIRDLGIECTSYETMSRTPTDPTELSDIVSKLMTVGVLTPDEGREVSEGIFNRDFKNLNVLWSKISPRILTALLQTKNQLVAAAAMSNGEDVEKRLQEAIMGTFDTPGESSMDPGATVAAAATDQSTDQSSESGVEINGNDAEPDSGGNRGTAEEGV